MCPLLKVQALEKKLYPQNSSLYCTLLNKPPSRPHIRGYLVHSYGADLRRRRNARINLKIFSGHITVIDRTLLCSVHNDTVNYTPHT